MGGGTHYGPIKDHAGHCIFAYQKKGDGTWRMVMTLASALRTSLEGYSKREFRIMPLVCCSIAGMGVCYSYIPDEMIARVIPAGVPQIYSSKDVEIELGVLKEADAVIKAAKEGFTKACEEGGTRHWFTRQLLMALDPINEGLTFCNAWMIQNAKARYLIDCWLEGKVMATLEKSAKDLIVPPGTGPWDALALKPHDEDEEYRCDELKTSSTHTWDNDLFIGFRFWQNYLLLHLVKFWGVRVFCYYSVGPDLKPRLKTIFAASIHLFCGDGVWGFYASYAAQNWYRHRRRLWARLEGGAHVESIPEVEPNKDHCTSYQTTSNSKYTIPRFPKEVYVDGYRVYYVKDKNEGTFWQQDTQGHWVAMPNPDTAHYVDLRDLEPFARDPKEPLVSIYEGNDPDKWVQEHNLIASLSNEPLVSMAESNLDCSNAERTTHNTMLLHFTRALCTIIIGMNVFSEGKLHCALRVKERIVHACIATISPNYNKDFSKIECVRFGFSIEVARGVHERWTHSAAGVAVGVFAPTEKEKKLLGINLENERVAYVVLPTTKKAWDDQEFPKYFSIDREDMREFYKTGRVPSEAQSHSERLMFAGMCFEEGLQGKVEEFGALDIEYMNDQKTLFPLDMTGRLKLTGGHLRQLLPLADALAASRKKRAEKEATQEEKLANRTVVKHPDVEKPDDWKPDVPPAPKEKKAPSANYMKRKGRYEDVDYSRPRYVTSRRRRRRDPDGDAEEGEVLE